MAIVRKRPSMQGGVIGRRADGPSKLSGLTESWKLFLGLLLLFVARQD